MKPPATLKITLEMTMYGHTIQSSSQFGYAAADPMSLIQRIADELPKAMKAARDRFLIEMVRQNEGLRERKARGL